MRQYYCCSSVPGVELLLFTHAASYKSAPHSGQIPLVPGAAKHSRQGSTTSRTIFEAVFLDNGECANAIIRYLRLRKAFVVQTLAKQSREYVHGEFSTTAFRGHHLLCDFLVRDKFSFDESTKRYECSQNGLYGTFKFSTRAFRSHNCPCVRRSC